MTGPAFLIGLALGALSVLLLLAALGGDTIARAHDDDDEADVAWSPDTEAAIAQALTVANRPAVALAVVHQLHQREQGR